MSNDHFLVEAYPFGVIAWLSLLGTKSSLPLPPHKRIFHSLDMECFRWAKRKLHITPSNPSVPKPSTMPLIRALTHEEPFTIIDTFLTQDKLYFTKETTPTNSSLNSQAPDISSPNMNQAAGLSRIVSSRWNDMITGARANDGGLRLDGKSLGLAGLVACARYVKA